MHYLGPLRKTPKRASTSHRRMSEDCVAIVHHLVRPTTHLGLNDIVEACAIADNAPEPSNKHLVATACVLFLLGSVVLWNQFMMRQWIA